ncbi:uncharacterized protein GGS25DRAFT_519905 [Hypoxylon fragiforme]|uniref:uncharacterized protein n=1 Tax=Hypoxylon fragiforme TaxID=63214 RepID=UPI0020C5FEAE|nr:uncharacterized protein GGS25DRAFT_519905 [Hypoxylon fragiforme]KAI2611597.1 hypothetical protein GGS25DRAFT_519905 [Hypoxylon fragiforme]
MALVAQLRWLQSQFREQIDPGCTFVRPELPKLFKFDVATGTAHGPPTLPP